MAQHEQPPLPFDEKDVSRHDYGGMYSDDDAGHEYPFVLANDPTAESRDAGISVSLDDRYFVMAAMAQLYARRARSKGLSTAAEIAPLRKKLKGRYPDLDELVANTVAKAHYTADDEKRVLARVLKTNELIQAGFHPVDAEEAEQQTILQIRHAIGTTVGAKTRNENLKKAKRTVKAIADPNR